ncbi:MAG TPA: CoA ester lyase [bacterium]|nr:CoA ester lyase [bacterium]
MNPNIAPGGKVRSERSLLSVPASSERFLSKAAASAADTILLDLEDSVAPEQKQAARQVAIAAASGLDWGGKTLLVRINGLDTPWAYQDLIELTEACPRLDGVMVPKVQAPRDVQFVETLLSQVEMSRGRQPPVFIEAQIESPLALIRAEEIAASCPRLESISFGPGDYAASLGNRMQRIGGPDPDYVILTDGVDGVARQQHWGDVWHYPLSRVAAACHAFGLRAMDGPYVDFKDEEGFRAAARRAKALGYEGKWCIHPNQVPLANEIFSPSPQDITWARMVLEQMGQAHQGGQGAIALAGQMLDMAQVRQAQGILAKAQRMGL